jgi:outer membrane lipoprotein LolB
MSLRVRERAPLSVLLVVGGIVAGCASPGTKVTGAGVPAASLHAWEAAGRLAVAASGQGGSGSFLWQQSGERSRIRLSGPVGVGGLEVELDAATLRVATSDGRSLESEAARHELEARLGAALPAANLRYWMLGLPAPGPHRWYRDEQGRQVLEQNDWRIEYGDFATSRGTELPTRLTATAGDTRVRLVVDRWNLAVEP